LSYDPGDVWEPTLEVRDEDGALKDATVTVTITDPDGTTSTPSVTHVSTGVYRASVLLTTAGPWTATWTVTGAVTGVETQVAYARRLGSNVISVSEVRDRLDKTLTVDDDEIASMLDAALAEYEEWVGPVTGTVVEKHDGGALSLILRNRSAATIVSAGYTDGTTISVDDLDLDTTTGIVHWGYNTAGVFTRGLRNVEITYTVGSLSANHREAIIADVAGYFAATQRGPASMPGEGYEAGWQANPLVLFPRIRALAVSAIA
jgi:hypothetical protein